jgi:dTDP-4-dehydrorhamnose reductase
LKVLVLGRDGQVGWELERTMDPSWEKVCLGRGQLDLTDTTAIRDTVATVRPGIIFNAAAYTAVDRAETDSSLAFAVNAAAPAALAHAARSVGAMLVHFSTDYVFSGDLDRAYTEEDATDPAGVYARSKLEGEHAVLDAGCKALVFRTSWVYASRGKNFLLTMLRLGKEGKALRVVSDQIGAPTWAREIAMGSMLAAEKLTQGTGTSGVFHMTAAGSTSWHGFAREIFAMSGLSVDLTPIPTSEYPLPAKRPMNSRLDCTKLRDAVGIELPDWKASLGECIGEVARK